MMMERLCFSKAQKPCKVLASLFYRIVEVPNMEPG